MTTMLTVLTRGKVSAGGDGSVSSGLRNVLIPWETMICTGAPALQRYGWRQGGIVVIH